MMKAGVIEEMMNDAVDDAMDVEDLEEETEAQVDKVLMELAGESLTQMTAAPKTKLVRRRLCSAAFVVFSLLGLALLSALASVTESLTGPQAAQQEAAAEEEPPEEMDELQERLNAVRS